MTVLASKPNAIRQGWQIRASRHLYQSHWYNVRQDDIRLPDGQEITFTQIEHPGFVSIVPVTPDRQIVLIYSYRYTVDDWVWEIPAGGLGNKPGLTPLAVAQEELAEEVGGSATDWRSLGSYYAGIGSSNVRAHVFLATGVQLNGQQHLESTEIIQVRTLPVAAALSLARSGAMEDGQSILALLLCEPLLREMMTGEGA